MVRIDLNKQTYTCPFCGHDQAYVASSFHRRNVDRAMILHNNWENYEDGLFDIYTLVCNNSDCREMTVTAIRVNDNYQVDIVPQSVIKKYPDYIPEQIRNDYYEANLVLDSSPKAAATLARRCLQGMIHDFWNVHGKNLNAEISALKGLLPTTQWNAIDGLRRIGNIGAHMEQDVNMIIDVEPSEAKKLLKLIELLLEKWYVARHDEEKLLREITRISDEKETLRKANIASNKQED